MVAMVSGQGTGLFEGQMAPRLGGGLGTAQQGRGKENVYINVSRGNLVLQRQDEWLTGRGGSAAAVRTYDSQGQFTDDNGDRWWLADYRRVRVDGAGMPSRITADGSVQRFSRLGEAYVSTDGDGAHDSLRYDRDAKLWIWTDGSLGIQERYEDPGASGDFRLKERADLNGNVVNYRYDAAGLLSEVKTANGESLLYRYQGHQLISEEVRYLDQDGVTYRSASRTYYEYDKDRLSTVTVDLSPEDKDVKTGARYVTSYEYLGDSQTIAAISQTDGSRLNFTYTTGSDGVQRIQSVTEVTESDAAGMRGRVTVFRYDLARRETTVVDPMGFETRYAYDADNRLLAVTGPAVDGVAQKLEYQYDPSGNLTRRVAQGLAVDYRYDLFGNLYEEKDSAGTTIHRNYGGRGELLTETVTTSDGLALTSRQVYDERLNLRFTVSAEGRVTEYRYDAHGQRQSQISYVDARYEAAASLPLDLTQMLDWLKGAKGAVERDEYQYDARGQLKAKTTAFGTDRASTTRYVYDATGQLLTQIDGNGNQSSFQYDGLWRLTKTTDAQNLVSQVIYDDAGKRIERHLNGVRLDTEIYDATGAMIGKTEGARLPNAADLSEVPDRSPLPQAPLATAGVTEAARSQRFRYDANGRLRYSESGEGLQTVRQHILYDAAGRRVAEISGDGSLIEFRYDRYGRLRRTVNYANRLDAAALARLVNAQGEPLPVKLADIRPPADPARDQGSWTFYDKAGRLAKQLDASRFLSEMRFDGAGRLVAKESYGAIDAAVDLDRIDFAEELTARPAGESRLTRAFYDKDGRLIGELDGEGYLLRHEYDGAGRLWHTTAFATVSPGTAATRRGMTLAQLTPAADPANDQHRYRLFDARGQLSGVLDAEGYLTEYEYDPAGNKTAEIRYGERSGARPASSHAAVASLRPADTQRQQRSHFFYDTLNRLIEQRDREDGETSGLSTRYGYDRLGNLTLTAHGERRVDGAPSPLAAIKPDEQRVTLRRYDLQGRVIGEIGGEGVKALMAAGDAAARDAVWLKYGAFHQYDKAGRLLATLRRDPEQATRVLRTSFFYDGAGRLLATINPDGELSTIRYDGRGRAIETRGYAKRVPAVMLGGLTGGSLSEAELFGDGRVPGLIQQANLESANDQVVSHRYDARGQLVESRDAAGVTRYRYNAFAEVERRERDLGAGKTSAEEYAYDARGLKRKTVEILTSEARVDNDAGAKTRESVTVYDAFGRVAQQVDAMGVTTAQGYDRRDRVISIQVGGGRSVIEYDAQNRVLSKRDALGNTTRYRYESGGRLRTVINPENVELRARYDVFGQLRLEESEGGETRYAYDLDGRLVLKAHLERSSAAGAGILDAAGDEAKGKWRPALGLGEAVTLDTRNQRFYSAQVFYYDALGRRVFSADTVSMRQIGDEAEGRDYLIADPAYERVIWQRFDAAGRVTDSVADPVRAGVTGLHQHTVRRFDGLGRLVEEVAPNGTLTRTEYDAKGRVLAVTIDPDGLRLRSEFAYDGADRVIRTVEGAGSTQPRVTEYDYDAAGRRYRETVRGDAATPASVIDYRYDAADRVVSKVLRQASDASATGTLRTLYVYDELGRKTHEINGAGEVKETVYDLAGRVVGTRDYANRHIQQGPIDTAAARRAFLAALRVDPQNDRVTRCFYDPAGRLWVTIDAEGGVIERRYGYSRQGLQGGDLLSEEIRYAKPFVAELAMPVDSQIDAKMVRQVLDQQLKGPGDQRVRYDYDLRGRVIATWRGDAASANEGLSRIASQRHNYFGAVEYSLDAEGGLTEYRYDRVGRQIEKIDPLGNVTETVYDDRGRSREVRQWKLPSREWGGGRLYYRRNGVISFVGPDGQRLTVRNPAAETLFLSAEEKNLPAPPAGIDRQLLMPPAHEAREDQVVRYLYDAAGRLERTLSGLGADVAMRAGLMASDAQVIVERYGYTALDQKAWYQNARGDRTDYRYDAQGRLSHEVSAVFQVLARDNLLQDEASMALQNASLVKRYSYDGAGRVKQLVEGLDGRVDSPSPLDAYSRVTDYFYDAAGRQSTVTRQSNQIVGGDDYAQRLLNSDQLALGFFALNRLGRFVGTTALGTETRFDSFGNAIAFVDQAGNRSYKAYDRLGRLRFEVDGEGFVTERQYDAFGNCRRQIRYETKLDPSDTLLLQKLGDSRNHVALQEWASAHPASRAMEYRYDAFDRLVETWEPQSDSFILTETGRGQLEAMSRRVVRNRYDQRGLLTKQSVAVESTFVNGRETLVFADTYFFYDALGRKIGQIDAEGGVTAWNYDERGQLREVVEYAKPAEKGAWLDTAPWQAVVDRVVGQSDSSGGATRVARYEYDHFGRKTAEIGMGQSQTVRHRYDAAGNEVATVDARGNETFRFFDALGRERYLLTASGERNGEAVFTVTRTLYDVHGNAVDIVRMASQIGRSELMALAPGGAIERIDLKLLDQKGLAYHPGTSKPDWQATEAGSQVERREYDRWGRLIYSRTFESGASNERAAAQTSAYAYNALGKVAAEINLERDNALNSLSGNHLVRTFKYDQTGRQIGTRELWSAPADARKLTAYDPLQPLPAEPIPTRELETLVEYNGYGEVLRRSVGSRTRNGVFNHQTVSSYDYDAAGHMWRKSENGVTSVHFYNLAGWETGLVIANPDGSGLDRLAAGNYQQTRALVADALVDTQSTGGLRRTYRRYDRLGRVTETRAPAFTDKTGDAKTAPGLEMAGSAVTAVSAQVTSSWTTYSSDPELADRPENRVIHHELSVQLPLASSTPGTSYQVNATLLAHYAGQSYRFAIINKMVDGRDALRFLVETTHESGSGQPLTNLLLQAQVNGEVQWSVETVTVRQLRDGQWVDLSDLGRQALSYPTELADGRTVWLRVQDGNGWRLVAPKGGVQQADGRHLGLVSLAELGLEQEGQQRLVQLLAVAPGFELTADMSDETLVSLVTARNECQVVRRDGRGLVLFGGGATHWSRVLRPIQTNRYDRWSNLVAQTAPDGGQSSWRYNSLNQVTEARGPVVGKVDRAGRYDEAAQLVGYRYNAWGDRIAQTDGNGNTLFTDYDRFGRRVAERRGNGEILKAWTYDGLGRLASERLDNGLAATHYVYNALDQVIENWREARPNDRSELVRQVTRYVYDGRGQRLKEIRYATRAGGVMDTVTEDAEFNSAFRQEQSYLYDSLGRLLRSDSRETVLGRDMVTFGLSPTSYDGLRRLYEYDELGNKIRERVFSPSIGDPLSDAAIASLRWEYRAGTTLLATHTDLGGNVYRYEYAAGSGMLVSESVQQAQAQGGGLGAKYYAYNEAGQVDSVKQISSGVADKVQSYRYDLRGQVVHESMAQQGAVWAQSTRYDQAGRLVQVGAKGIVSYYLYDGADNRRAQIGHGRSVSTGWEGRVTWFDYDDLNRLIHRGSLPDRSLSPQLDAGWNGSSSRLGLSLQRGRAVEIANVAFRPLLDDGGGGEQIVYAGSGQRRAALNIRYSSPGALSQANSYEYDGFGRLVKQEAKGSGGGVETQEWRYDYQGRMVRETMRSMQGGMQLNRSERVNYYDTDGRVVVQMSNSDRNGQPLYWNGNGERPFGDGNLDAQILRYNYLGDRLESYTISGGKNSDGSLASTEFHQFTYISLGSSWKEIGHARELRSATPLRSASKTTYDVFGNVLTVEDPNAYYKQRTFFTNTAGQIVAKLETTGAQPGVAQPLQTFALVGGTVVASNGGGAGDTSFDWNFVGAQQMQGALTGYSRYTVKRGDTLPSIAGAVWGDTRLWYLIADANGLLKADSQLAEGSTLQLPSVVNSANDASVFRPHSPGALIGDTSPALPAPPPPPGLQGCGVKQILVMIVAVVVAVWTANAATPYLAELFGASTAGQIATAAAAGAVGGAAGSVASQGVAMALNIQDKFDWKQVGKSAVMGGISAGLAKGLGIATGGAAIGDKILGTDAPAFLRQMVTGMTTRALSDGLMSLAGVGHFSWGNVAAAGLAAPVRAAIGDGLLGTPGDASQGLAEQPGLGGNEFMANFLDRTLGGTVERWVQVKLEGEGKIGFGQIAANAFGETLANQLVFGANNPNSGNRPVVLREDEGSVVKLGTFANREATLKLKLAKLREQQSLGEISESGDEELIQSLQHKLSPERNSFQKVSSSATRGFGATPLGRILFDMAHDLSPLYQDISLADSPEKIYNQFRKNYHKQFKLVEKLSLQEYGQAPYKTGMVGMARNAFLLMSYDSLQNHNPDFMWTKLGLFAANEVRQGLALAYTMQDLLRTNSSVFPKIGVLSSFGAEKAGEAAETLLRGQYSVLADIGSLGLMHKILGSKEMLQQKWLSKYAREAFGYQHQAELARARGDMKGFFDNQTEAAVQFGIHEQKYSLQPMWDKPLMREFARVNDMLLKQTGGSLGMRPDIYIGTSRWEFWEKAPVIIAPSHATNLWSLEDRVTIARNGFETLNSLRQDPKWKPWVDNSRARIGRGDNIYMPAIFGVQVGRLYGI